MTETSRWASSLGVPSWLAAAPGMSVPLVDAAAAKAGDAAAVDAGDTWAGLMERAAGHLARHTVAFAGYGYGLRVAILVGKGNNGGDGWAAASMLRDLYGASCWVVAVDGIEVAVSDEAATHRSRWLAHGGRVSVGTDPLDRTLAWADVAIDALLGTGTRGAPRAAAAVGVQALQRARAAGVTIVACDIPSGVSADDGVVEGADGSAAGSTNGGTDGGANGGTSWGVVTADLTVTFGALKRGLVLHPGAAHTGRIVLGDLGPRYAADSAGWSALTVAGAAPTPLVGDADKRARGTVTVVAGATGTSGAAVLAAEGALRTGAGLVTAAVPASVHAEVAARADAGVMVRPLTANADGAVDAVAAAQIDALTRHGTVVAGPGLRHGEGAAAVVARLREQADRLVLDADALNVHRDAPQTLAEHTGTLVLTPHQRELARIGGGNDGDDAWANRVERVGQLARQYNATVVAKGPGTIVAAPDARVWVCPITADGAGVPALGSGGTGDTLAGIIGAAIATADDVPLAVAQAVFWHAAAGVAAGRDRAGRASATDLLAMLGPTLHRLSTGL